MSKNKIKTRKPQKAYFGGGNTANLKTCSPMHKAVPPADSYDFAGQKCNNITQSHRAGVLAAVAGYLKTHRAPQVRKQAGGSKSGGRKPFTSQRGAFLSSEFRRL